jgi:hypothetical protein
MKIIVNTVVPTMKNKRVCRLVILTSDPERRRGGLPPSSPASQHGLRLKTQATSSDTDTREVADTYPRRIAHRDDHDHEHDDAKGADERVGAGSGRNGKHSSVLLTSAFTDVGGMAQRHVQCGPSVHVKRPTLKRSLSVSNSLSGGDWELDEVPAVGDPAHVARIGKGLRVSTDESRRRVSLQ